MDFFLSIATHASYAGSGRTTHAELGQRHADNGREDKDVGTDAHEGGEPGVTVHEVPQSSQIGLDVQSCLCYLDKLGLHLDVEGSHFGMGIWVKGGEEGDRDGLLLLCPANQVPRPRSRCCEALAICTAR